MLFNRDNTLKNIRVLSEGEKICYILSKMILEKANLLSKPTNQYDFASITSLINLLISLKGTILLNLKDHEFIKTVYNSIIEIGSIGFIENM